MKKLQNNFTTPEQSKRLLEIGVPVDSADCYIRLDFNVTESPDIIRYHATFSEIKKRNEIIDKNFIPCWSVGRLIEIIIICSTAPFPCEVIITRENVNFYIVETLIRRLEELANYYSLDFSKLEE